MTQPNPVLPERAPASEKDPIFAPFSDPQSYLNLLYLLLAFPLGIAYFVFVVTGLSLSVGLLIVWVGIPPLLGLLAASIGLASFERLLARQLLGVEIRGARNGSPVTGGFWRRVGAFLSRPDAWLALVYLLLKFVLGIVSFTLLVSLFSASLGMIATPFFYEQVWWQVGIPGLFEVDSFGMAAAIAMLGAILGVASFHLMNGVAWVYGHIAKAMLELPA